MTPSGVPPMPSRMSAPDSGHAVEMAPATSPSGMSRMRAPVARTSAISVAVAGPVEDDHGDVPHRLTLGPGHRLDVVRR